MLRRAAERRRQGGSVGQNLTLDGQRTHIRKYYPTLFVEAAARDMRGFVPDMLGYQGLRSRWMNTRLAKMGEILRDRGLTMEEYTDQLRSIEKASTPRSPTRALGARSSGIIKRPAGRPSACSSGIVFGAIRSDCLLGLVHDGIWCPLAE